MLYEVITDPLPGALPGPGATGAEGSVQAQDQAQAEGQVQAWLAHLRRQRVIGGGLPPQPSACGGLGNPFRQQALDFGQAGALLGTTVDRAGGRLAQLQRIRNNFV